MPQAEKRRGKVLEKENVELVKTMANSPVW